MCMNYNNLNKACINDIYPLPKINNPVCGATRPKMLSVTHKKDPLY